MSELQTKIDAMPLYQQAEALLKAETITLESVQSCDNLLSQAVGEEADMIGQVYEGLIAGLSVDEFEHYEDWMVEQLEI